MKLLTDYNNIFIFEKFFNLYNKFIIYLVFKFVSLNNKFKLFNN